MNGKSLFINKNFPKPQLVSSQILYLILGAQFGTVISMPLSGLLSISAGGWPSIFYVFGAVGTVWCIAFLFLVYEDPQTCKKITLEERKYIQNSLGAIIGHNVTILLICKSFHFDYCFQL